MIMMLLDVQSVGHSCARTHNRPFYSREPERYYLYYPVHTNAFSLLDGKRINHFASTLQF